MSKQITVTVQTAYSGKKTTIRASVKRGLTGARYLSITSRSLLAAQIRGMDAINVSDIPAVAGYGPWQQDTEGYVVAWQQNAL